MNAHISKLIHFFVHKIILLLIMVYYNPGFNSLYCTNKSGARIFRIIINTQCIYFSSPSSSACSDWFWAYFLLLSMCFCVYQLNKIHTCRYGFLAKVCHCNNDNKTKVFLKIEWNDYIHMYVPFRTASLCPFILKLEGVLFTIILVSTETHIIHLLCILLQHNRNVSSIFTLWPIIQAQCTVDVIN